MTASRGSSALLTRRRRLPLRDVPFYPLQRPSVPGNQHQQRLRGYACTAKGVHGQSRNLHCLGDSCCRVTITPPLRSSFVSTHPSSRPSTPPVFLDQELSAINYSNVYKQLMRSSSLLKAPSMHQSSLSFSTKLVCHVVKMRTIVKNVIKA